MNFKPNHRTTEPHKCWRWRCCGVVGSCCGFRSLRLSLPATVIAVLLQPPRLGSCTFHHGERRPLTNTRPRFPQTPLLIHLFVPPATSIQRIAHPHRTRARLLQCPARPRHRPDIIKTVRLGRSEDHSPPHHSPRCVSRSRQRGAHGDVARSHDRVVGQMGYHRCDCVRRTSLVIGNSERRWCHCTESHRDGIGHAQWPVERRCCGRLT